MTDIFRYLDYRKFLRDYYEKKKQENPHFSHRYIAGKLGFDSGYFAKIIQTERHISVRLAQRFTDFLQLTSQESDYFLTLVLFAKAKTQSEKTRHFEKLLSFKQSEAAVLSTKQYGIFDKWYYPAVRELIACFEFNGDYVDLARKVQPPISPGKAKKAIATLERLGLVKKNDLGIYERVEPVWTTNRDIESVLINNMQIAMLDLAKEAFDRFPRCDRDMSTLTMSVSAEEYRRINEDLANLRRRFLEMARNCKKPDQVYHLSLALFPLSKKEQM
jgi:uncharacterized protein (TIGR02147 family)